MYVVSLLFSWSYILKRCIVCATIKEMYVKSKVRVLISTNDRCSKSTPLSVSNGVQCTVWYGTCQDPLQFQFYTLLQWDRWEGKREGSVYTSSWCYIFWLTSQNRVRYSVSNGSTSTTEVSSVSHPVSVTVQSVKRDPRCRLFTSHHYCWWGLRPILLI